MRGQKPARRSSDAFTNPRAKHRLEKQFQLETVLRITTIW
jgi:hypothetical protein